MRKATFLCAAANAVARDAVEKPRFGVFYDPTTPAASYAAKSLRRMLLQLQNGQVAALAATGASPSNRALLDAADLTILLSHDGSGGDEFRLRRSPESPNLLSVSATSDAGLIFATAHIAERLGARFDLHGPM